MLAHCSGVPPVRVRLLPSCPVSPLLAGRGIILLSSVPLAPHPHHRRAPCLSRHALCCCTMGRRVLGAAVPLPPAPRGKKRASPLPGPLPDAGSLGSVQKVACELGGSYVCLWLQGWLDRSCLHAGLSPAPLLHGSSHGRWAKDRHTGSMCSRFGKRLSMGSSLAEAEHGCLQAKAMCCYSR